jgi:predicted TPR repeat methyltransferase
LSSFDERAKNWDKSSRRFQVAKSFADFVKQNINIDKNMDLLDYGCGTGLVAYQFDGMVSSITGMDSSQKMLEEFIAKKEDSNIKALKHDINSDSLPKESFDIIVSSMTMHHIKDVNRFFAQAFDSLKSGSYLAIADLDAEDGTFHDRGNDGVEHFGFAKDEVEKFFAQNGFELLKYDYTFQIDKNDKEYKIFSAVAKKI